MYLKIELTEFYDGLDIGFGINDSKVFYLSELSYQPNENALGRSGLWWWVGTPDRDQEFNVGYVQFEMSMKQPT